MFLSTNAITDADIRKNLQQLDEQACRLRKSCDACLVKSGTIQAVINDYKADSDACRPEIEACMADLNAVSVAYNMYQMKLRTVEAEADYFRNMLAARAQARISQVAPVALAQAPGRPVRVAPVAEIRLPYGQVTRVVMSALADDAIVTFAVVVGRVSKVLPWAGNALKNRVRDALYRLKKKGAVEAAPIDGKVYWAISAQ